MNTLITILISAVTSLGTIFGFHQIQPAAPVVTPAPLASEAPTLGAFNPTGGGTYRLQSSIGGSATSLTLSSFKEPVSNIKYTMTYLNSSIEYATIEPQSSSKEFISFTGITQNSDGTATLTGISRGLGFSYPYTASTTLQQSHSGQSILILSNPPQLYNQYANKSNTETITGNWTFTGQSTFTTFPITPNNATSSINVAGISQLATPAQQAAGTATSTNGTVAPLVLSSQYATSTWNTNTSSNVVPVTGSNGRLAQGFLANTTGIASSSSLQTDAAGNSYWIPGYRLLNTDSFTTATMGLTASTSLFTATVPANTFGTNGMIHGKLFGMTSGGSGLAHFDLAYGGASTTYRINPGLASGPQPFQLDFYIKENNLTNSQKTYFTTASTSPFSTGTFPNGFAGATSTTAVDTTQSQRLQMIIFTSQPTLGYSFDFMTLEILR